MPPTRRKTPATTANSRNQKQLSFGPQNSGNRITKPSAATQSKKEKSLEGRKASAAYEKPSVASIPATPSPGPEDPVSDPAPPSPIKRSPRTQKNERQQLQTTTSSSSARPIAIRKQTGPPAIPPSSTVGRKQQTSSSTAIATVPTTGNLKSDAALRVNDAQIRKYWRTKEDARIAPRVHQQGLNVNEKVLREFDACSQFGPCIGIPRLKRWKRADGLGLRPPLEVLAVLLKEERDGNKKAERAYMEGLLSSRQAPGAAAAAD